MERLVTSELFYKVGELLVPTAAGKHIVGGTWYEGRVANVDCRMRKSVL